MNNTKKIPDYPSNSKEGNILDQVDKDNKMSYLPIQDRLDNVMHILDLEYQKANANNKSTIGKETINSKHKLTKTTSAAHLPTNIKYESIEDENAASLKKNKGRLSDSLPQIAISTLNVKNEALSMPLLNQIESISFSYENKKSELLDKIVEIKEGQITRIVSSIFKTEAEKRVDQINYEIFKNEVGFDNLTNNNKILVDSLNKFIEGKVCKDTPVPIDILLKINEESLKKIFEEELENISTKYNKISSDLSNDISNVENGIELTKNKVNETKSLKKEIFFKVKESHQHIEKANEINSKLENENTFLKWELVKQKKSCSVLKKQMESDIKEYSKMMNQLVQDNKGFDM
jgi:hypothetical protein